LLLAFFLMIEMIVMEPWRKDSERTDLAHLHDPRVAETVRLCSPRAPAPAYFFDPRFSDGFINLSGSISVRAPRGSFAPSSRRGRPLPVPGSPRTRAYKSRRESGAKQETDPVQTPSLDRRIHLDQFILHADQTRQIKPFPPLTRHKIHIINNRWPIITILLYNSKTRQAIPIRSRCCRRSKSIQVRKPLQRHSTRFERTTGLTLPTSLS
jgi:hypothetical protein